MALKALLWAVPVVFGAGGFYSMVGATSSHLTEKVAEVEVEVEDHVALDAHPVTKTRLDIIVDEQREMRAEIKSQSASLAAICQATGAQCR